MKTEYDLAGKVIGLAMKIHSALGADFLIESELIVELKAVQSLATAHEVQTVNYLVATGKDVGLLLNFGSERLEFKKKFRQPKSKQLEEISF